MAIQILFADRNLNVIGDPLADWSSLDVTLKLNEPASGTIEMAAWPEVMENLQPGNRVVIIRDGEVWTTGPMEVPQEYTWGIGDTSEPDPGKVVVHFTDDLAMIAGYVTYIQKNDFWINQPVTRDENHISPAGVNIGVAVFNEFSLANLIKTIVRNNCGDWALSDRQLPHLSFPPHPTVSQTMTFWTRFEPLLDAARRVVDAATDPLAFRTRIADDWASVEFQTYLPEDKSATARFSKGLGNLRYVNFKHSAPTCTRALIEGTYVEEKTTSPTHPARRSTVQLTNATNKAAWWHVEKVASVANEVSETTGLTTTAGSAQLNDAAAALHVTDGPKVELATVTVDTEDLKAGRDFNLGDTVTVELPTGLPITAVVRAIQLKAEPSGGEVVTSTIGTAEATTDASIVRTIQDLSRRLGKIEKRGNIKN